MRIVLVSLLTLAALAQTPKTPELSLRGDRFRPLTYSELTPAQKTLADNLLSGERAGMNGPFNVMLRSPEMGDLAQKFGAQMRFHSSLPKKLNEMVIILTARSWTSQYEWYAHKRAALMAGLSPAIVDAIANGRKPAGMDADEQIIYSFVTELLNNKGVSDATFKAARDRFTERGVVDMIGVMGYYHLVSMLLNVDRYPLPDGEKPDLKPLTK